MVKAKEVLLQKLNHEPTYQEIADKLGISKNGVRWNLDDMVEKGGFENREALVVTAIENKLMVTTLKDE